MNHNAALPVNAYGDGTTGEPTKQATPNRHHGFGATGRFSHTLLHSFIWLLIFATPLLSADVVDISSELENLRMKNKLPACAAAVIEDGKITVIGATGLRRADREARVTRDDIWHIGSCTKSMTATLVGVLVDAGKLRWDMTVPEALPDAQCDDGWKNVTIEHLVTHRGGMPMLSRAEWHALEVATGTPRKQRETFAKMLLARPPEEAAGKYAYSNSGYGLLGAIMEHVMDASFEDLLTEKVFKPLALKTAGFGPPATPRKLDQPWGHYRDGEHLTPASPVPENMFPTALAPAGSVHVSLTDFVRYAAWLSSGEPKLVSHETFKRLQIPPDGSSYAGGVWMTELPGIGGKAVSHCGDLGGFFSAFYATPKFAVVAVFNTDGAGWQWLGDEITALALKAATGKK